MFEDPRALPIGIAFATNGAVDAKKAIQVPPTKANFAENNATTVICRWNGRK